MPECPARDAQTPLDLAVDVILLQLPRYVCEATIARYRLPMPGPLFCNDWAQLLPSLLDHAALTGVSDLRALMLGRIDALIADECARAATQQSLWSHLAGLHRDLYDQACARPFPPAPPRRG
jgi:hypothetical protein